MLSHDRPAPIPPHSPVLSEEELLAIVSLGFVDLDKAKAQLVNKVYRFRTAHKVLSKMLNLGGMNEKRMAVFAHLNIRVVPPAKPLETLPQEIRAHFLKEGRYVFDMTKDPNDLTCAFTPSFANTAFPELPLSWAINQVPKKHLYDVLKALFAIGANVNMRDLNGTPVWYHALNKATVSGDDFYLKTFLCLIGIPTIKFHNRVGYADVLDREDQLSSPIVNMSYVFIQNNTYDSRPLEWMFLHPKVKLPDPRETSDVFTLREARLYAPHDAQGAGRRLTESFVGLIEHGIIDEDGVDSLRLLAGTPYSLSIKAMQNALLYVSGEETLQEPLFAEIYRILLEAIILRAILKRAPTISQTPFAKKHPPQTQMEQYKKWFKKISAYALSKNVRRNPIVYKQIHDILAVISTPKEVLAELQDIFPELAMAGFDLNGPLSQEQAISENEALKKSPLQWAIQNNRRLLSAVLLLANVNTASSLSTLELVIEADRYDLFALIMALHPHSIRTALEFLFSQLKPSTVTTAQTTCINPMVSKILLTLLSQSSLKAKMRQQSDDVMGFLMLHIKTIYQTPALSNAFLKGDPKLLYLVTVRAYLAEKPSNKKFSDYLQELKSTCQSPNFLMSELDRVAVVDLEKSRALAYELTRLTVKRKLPEIVVGLVMKFLDPFFAGRLLRGKTLKPAACSTMPQNSISTAVGNAFNSAISEPSTMSDDEILATTEQESLFNFSLAQSQADYEWIYENEITLGNRDNLEQPLKIQANRSGFQCHDVAMDGNCFYLAVHRQLSNALKAQYPNAQALRCAAAHYIAQHKERFAGFVSGGHTIDDVIRRHKEPGVWANALLITALSYALNLTLAVIRDDGEAPTLIIQPSSQHSPIILGYQVGRHYQSLEDYDANKASVNVYALIAAQLNQGQAENERNSAGHPREDDRMTAVDEQPASTANNAVSTTTHSTTEVTTQSAHRLFAKRKLLDKDKSKESNQSEEKQDGKKMKMRK